uniref:Uncharacterized protein n=1 Tax=Anguilla anguilla TaxID=7936 RepID=A0A0E9WZM3_ANGAN
MYEPYDVSEPITGKYVLGTNSLTLEATLTVLEPSQSNKIIYYALYTSNCNIFWYEISTQKYKLINLRIRNTICLFTIV